MATRRLQSLDGLRGAAALVVVVYHIMGHSSWFHDGMYDFHADGWAAWIVTMTPVRMFFDGRVAVIGFFVLSGFVLSRAFWRRQSTDWPRYFVRRAVRLYPPVVASVLFAVVLLAVKQSATGEGHGWVDLSAAGSSVSKLVTDAGLLGLTNSPLNVVWWSLRWEAWFSILLPVVFVGLIVVGCGPNRRFSRTPSLFGVACVLLVVAQPWIRVTYQIPDFASRALLYLPMFGVGVACAAFEPGLRHDGWLQRRHIGWSLLLIVVLLVGARGPLGALVARGQLDPLLGTGLAIGLPLVAMALAVALLIGWPVADRAFSARPIAWVGERSFSLYLVHLPLIGLLQAAFMIQGAPVWFVALCVAASLGAMTVFHRVVEKPSIRLASLLGRRRRTPTERDLTAGVGGVFPRSVDVKVTGPAAAPVRLVD